MSQERYVQIPVSAFMDLQGKGLKAKEEPQYARVSELARRYSVSPYILYDAIKNDATFPVINLGKKSYRIQVDKFERWLTDRSKRKTHIPTAKDLLEDMLNAQRQN